MFKRLYEMPVAGRMLPLPFYFPSISSVKSNLSVLEYSRLLSAVKYPGFLISAYDIFHAPNQSKKRIFQTLHGAVENGQTILMDSGNYECYWLRDFEWDLEKFRAVCAMTPAHLVFCLDGTKPENRVQKIIATSLRTTRQSQKRTDRFTVLPIVHAPDQSMPKAVEAVARHLSPLMIAVPERELGNGIVERAKTILKIRKELNKTGRYYPLHLLGTGNPLSILIYTAAGADSFDGLEWCQTVVDHQTALLHHFHHWDFFEEQTAVKRFTKMPFVQKALTHNLIFFKNWMNELRRHLVQKNLSVLSERYLKKSVLVELKKAGIGGL